jgi:predicted RNA-binding Zn-ribbon protein involved in translation (DUF1610 family)
MKKPTEAKGIKCSSCGYVWKTKSRLFYVTCPRCRKLIPNDINTGKKK